MALLFIEASVPHFLEISPPRREPVILLLARFYTASHSRHVIYMYTHTSSQRPNLYRRRSVRRFDKSRRNPTCNRALVTFERNFLYSRDKLKTIFVFIFLNIVISLLTTIFPCAMIKLYIAILSKSFSMNIVLAKEITISLSLSRNLRRVNSLGLSRRKIFLVSTAKEMTERRGNGINKARARRSERTHMRRMKESERQRGTTAGGRRGG